jgi:hypothetical protein
MDSTQYRLISCLDIDHFRFWISKATVDKAVKHELGSQYAKDVSRHDGLRFHAERKLSICVAASALKYRLTKLDGSIARRYQKVF